MESMSVYKVESVGIWFAHEQLERRHWCAYGTLPLPKTESLTITVEINPPNEGVDRRVAGVLAADSDGAVFLCHTGKLGGGKQGVGQESFLAWYKQDLVPVIDPDGRSSQVLTVAQIGSPRLVEQIAVFVTEVSNFKAGRPSPGPSSKKRSFAGNEDEFEGDKQVGARGAYTACCDHGIVRNRLADLIEATGHAVSRDLQRDLLVGKPTAPDIEFEIKTLPDSQSVYTAVGQLFVHNTTLPVKQHVAVLPEGVTTSTQTALTSLNIDLVTYEWSDEHIRFMGLDKIIPGIDTTAPINSSK